MFKRKKKPEPKLEPDPNAVPGPPLPTSPVPHVFVEKGIGFGYTTKRLK